MITPLIIVHGGVWCNGIYTGGTKDYIPIPIHGFSYEDLLEKLRDRLDKETTRFSFRILALVEVDEGETIQMKVTNNFEWATLMDMTKYPTLYVNAVPLPCSREIVVAPQISLPNFNFPLSITGNNNRLDHIFNAAQHSSKDLDESPICAEPITTGQIEFGSIFMTKESMICAVHAYHLKNFAQFLIAVSNKDRFHIQCRFELTCVFCLKSKAVGSSWRIYKLVEHSCVSDLRMASEPTPSSRAVAEYVLPSMGEDGFVVRPRDIQGQFLREFGVRLKYPTALAGRNRALKAMCGDHYKSFQMVANYLHMLQETNPGSVVDLQTDEENTFQYCFFALDAAIRGFRFCRPVLVIDATHLKGTYRGVMFCASTKDGNNQIVPLAFGIGDKENDMSWTWFLTHVRDSFGIPDNLLIVSDQHISIRNAVNFVFPGTAHGLCTYHIQGNLRNFRDSIIEIFQLAANAYKETDFNEHMKNLEISAPGAYSKLMGIDPKKWARCKCPVRRYAEGTSNAVESLNSRLRWGRKLPITSLLEYARNLTQSWFYQRRTKSGNCDKEFADYAEVRISNVIAKANSLKVQPISNVIFNITHVATNNIVDLSKRECTCKVFQMDLFPCSHAAAAIRFRNENPLSYVHSHYSTQTWRSTYSSLIMPVPALCDWHTPDDIANRTVETPTNPKQAGRPQTIRIPSGAPPSQKTSKSCTRCKPVGHYANVCNVRIDLPAVEVEGCTNQIKKRRRQPKKCGICGVQGHTRQSYKDPRRFE